MQRLRSIAGWRNYKYFAGTALYLAISIQMALQIGAVTGMDRDFPVFWFAGENFSAGSDLYSQVGGAKRFIYPPFAAMLFQALALVPMEQAAILFSLLNFILLHVILWQVYSIFRYAWGTRAVYPVALAAVLSFRFFWMNILNNQVNEIVLSLCLAGILAFLKGRETKAALWFAAATMLKVVPVFFLLWLCLRGKVRTWWVALGALLLFLLLPFLFRGIPQGVADIQQYYHSFLEPFRTGKVEPEAANHSLSAAIYRLSQPSDYEAEGYNYRLITLSESATRHVALGATFLISIAFLALLLHLRLRRLPLHPFEASAVFLVSHLLSGITWEYHLVSLAYVYASILWLDKNQLSTWTSRARYLLLAVIAAIAVIGRDTVGSEIFLYSGGYNLIPYTMLALLLYCFYVILSPAALTAPGIGSRIKEF